MTVSSRSRPTSPTRRSNTPLPDIPEAPTPKHTIMPGPNAFAQQAARMERHRYDTNAFYQQEVMQRRLVTPPAALHPALRPRVDLDIPAWREQRPEMVQLRDSSVTTMSPFINAGKENSPPLKLVPSPRTQQEAFPTRRSFIEERTEQKSHDASGDETERTPVFTYTPKLGASGFASSVGATPKKSRGLDAISGAEQTKSPRKGLLEKLRITNPRAPPAFSASSLSVNQTQRKEQKVPPKAQAVLGNSPPKTHVARSPSKKKFLFSRRTTEPSGTEISRGDLFRKVAETDNQPLVTFGKTPPTASTATFSDSVGKTPQTAYTSFSDPVHNRKHQTRAVSQTHSDAGGEKKEANKCGVSRSQSLQYFDRNVPPTPPAKNTPPHEKEKANKVEPEPITRKPLPYQRMFEDDTPTRETVRAIDPEGRISPTKFGNYGRKEMPVLVKRPSIYSMHASVYPDLNDASSFQEMKARVDGLGLEGLSNLPENFYSRNAEIIYSPSVYSTDWGAKRSSSCYGSPLVGRDGKFKQSPSMPAIYERHRASPSDATSHTKKSGSSDGTIPVMYPDLASDPSMSNLVTTSFHKPSRSLDTMAGREGIMPFHGSTHSRDHSNSPRHSTSSIFSKSVEDVRMSPATYNCPSAMPSPLQYLPATVYTPPARKKRVKEAETDKNQDMTSPLAKHHTVEEARSGSPLKRHSNLFDTAPTFPARPDTAFDTIGSGSSPRNSTGSHSRSDHTDPQKPRPTTPATSDASQPPFDKLDQVLSMLSGMAAQTQDVARMRDQLRTMTARLDERLAASEDVHESDPPAAYQVDGAMLSMAAFHRSQQDHVDMPTTEDVYPAMPASQRYWESMIRDEDENVARREAETQQNLTAPNAMKQLIDIVGGFARRVQALEARLGGDGDSDGKDSGESKDWAPLR